jgi:anti-sigma factor RsiW
MERHLSGCGSCREELEGWRRLESRLRAFPLVVEPASLKLAVMSRVAETRPAPVPVAYRPIDPVTVGALGVTLLGVAALLSGVGSSWDLTFDAGYWLDLAGDLGASGWTLAGNAAGISLGSFAQAAYTNLLEAVPVLGAAVLLALFALGPSELMSAVRIQSHE